MDILEEVCSILQQVVDFNLGKDVCPGNTRILWLKEELEKGKKHGRMANESVICTKITDDTDELCSLRGSD